MAGPSGFTSRAEGVFAFLTVGRRNNWCVRMCLNNRHVFTFFVFGDFCWWTECTSARAVIILSGPSKSFNFRFKARNASKKKKNEKKLINKNPQDGVFNEIYRGLSETRLAWAHRHMRFISMDIIILKKKYIENVKKPTFINKCTYSFGQFQFFYINYFRLERIIFSCCAA